MKPILASLFLGVIFGLAGCAMPLDPGPKTGDTAFLIIFAAASLTDAFEEIGRNFETAHPGVQVQFNFGGSQTLRTQIEQGAAADVFASANLKELDSLIDAGFAAAGAGQIFLTNQLVVILPEGNPGKVLSLQDLARPGVRLVFAAKEAPVGSYTLTVLANLESAFGPGYPQQVLHQVGSYEGDAKQVVAKVRLGEADAGIAYRSDAAAAPELLTLAIPNEANVAARYPIAPLLQSKQPELAQAFIGYVLSNAGQAVLQKWGFQPGP